MNRSLVDCRRGGDSAARALPECIQFGDINSAVGKQIGDAAATEEKGDIKRKSLAVGCGASDRISLFRRS